jgi:phage gpG-like protein
MNTKASGSGKIGLDTSGLDQLEKAFRDQMNRPMKIRIGIMGDHSARSGGGRTNAEIGASHEFGAPARNLPARSFLRVPLMDNLHKEIEKAGLFTKAAQNEVVKTGTVKPWLAKVQAVAQGIVKGAFTTGGYGKWKSWKGSYKSLTGEILVNTTQLRDSITSEIVE